MVGDWANPYTTMAYSAEAQIVREIGKFLVNGGLYRGSKPVLWSVVEQTALAEAEVEYYDHRSITVWVRFPIVTTGLPMLVGAAAVIWTTTPWTLPGNRAIAYSPTLDYVAMRVDKAANDSRARPGETMLVAASLADELAARAGIEAHSVLARFPGTALAATVARHPLAGQCYEFDVPLLPASFVEADQGTGLVHIAPGHGADDFEVGQAHGLPVPDTVGPDGVYLPGVPLFAGRAVYRADGKPGDANEAVIAAIDAAGGLLARGVLVHSYPHSWRSKAPLIFRNTPQWFISMSVNGLREKALAAIAETRWVPPQARNRIGAWSRAGPTGASRASAPGACRSRCSSTSDTGELLRDPAVVERIARRVRAGGRRCLVHAPTPRTSSASLRSGRIRAGRRTSLDVWFDSGSTHAFVLEQRPEPALAGRRSISKARTSIAAGSSPRCWKPAARAAARPTRRC